MFNKILHLPKDASLQARNAFRITLIGLPAASLAASFYLYLGLTNGAWQLYAWSADIWLLAVVLLISMILIRRDRMSSGVWLFLIAIPATFIAAVALIEGIGLLVGISIASLLSVIAGQTLSGKAINRANILGVVSGVAAVLLDLFGPAYRLPQPEPIRVFLPGILGVVILLYGFMAVRQFGNYSLSTKLLLGFAGILLLAGLFGVFAIRQQFQAADQTAITEASHVAETLGAVAAKNRADLQELVYQLHETQQRDVKVVGPDRRILADAVSENIGTIFVHDQNGEVTATLQDGTPRTFVEVSADYPQGIQQVVVPIQDEASGAITGAVILEYTQILYQITVAETERFAGKASEIIASNPAGLQDYTAAIFLSGDQSAVVVDLHKQTLADSIPENVGKLFIDDTNGEVTATLKDGQPRTFVEFSVDYPQGIQQVVAPIKDSGGKIIGAAILEPSTESEATALVQSIQVAETVGASVSQNQARVQELINALRESQQRHVAVVDLNKMTLADAESEHVGTIFENQSGEVAATLKDGKQRAFTEIDTLTRQSTELVVVPIKDETGNMSGAVILDYTSLYGEAQQRATTSTRTLVFLGMGALLLALVISRVISNSVSRPITQLSAAAQKIAGGQLDAPIPVRPSNDEIGLLAGAFKNMTDQLRALIGSLENRVAERTRNLELAAEVAHSVTQVRALDVMMKDACELIRKQFNLYYVQVYLIDASQTNLVLQSGTGSVGEQLISRKHSLPLNTGSINGRAAVEKRSVLISDTATSPAFKANQLLPDTRSEMAVPLLVGGRVVGVLDLQSEKSGSLNQEVLPAIEALAGQIAIAIQNANLLAETEQARLEVVKQAARLTRANWTDYLDAIHKPERLGFVFDRSHITPLVDMEETQLPESGRVVTVPIAVTGEPLGSLVVELDDQARAEQTSELVSIVARQVAQQIETLRLLESAERYRFEAEEASRRLTREGWKGYMKTNAGKELSFLYDLTEVRSYHHSGDQPTETSSTALPLKVRDEAVGKLVVQGLDSNDDESYELANAVVERLSAHIETLRLAEETEQALVKTQQLSRQNELILDSAGEGIFGLDVQGNHTFINPAAAEMLGYSVEELIGRHSHSTWHHTKPNGSPYPAEECPIYRSIHTGIEQRGQELFLRKDGSRMDVTFTATPIFEDDSVVGAVVTFTDITQQKREQEIIAQRARELAAVAEISTAASREMDVQKMLETVVHMTQRKFAMYHAHVFIYNENTDMLKIAACGWKGGDEHEGTHGAAAIPLTQEQSLVARAARLRQAVIVNDVHNEPGWLPNPLLPDTQAEMALPLVIGDQILGVLDVQSDRLNAFTEEDASIQTTLASQVATALQNARSFAQAQRQARQESMLNAISQKIQSATTVEAVLQIAARELGHALGAPLTIAQLGVKERGNGGKASAS